RLDERASDMIQMGQVVKGAQAKLQQKQDISAAEAAHMAEAATHYGKRYSLKDIGEFEAEGPASADLPTEWDPATMNPFKHPAWKDFQALCAGMTPVVDKGQASSLWHE